MKGSWQHKTRKVAPLSVSTGRVRSVSGLTLIRKVKDSGVVKNNFLEYCSSTGVHGIRYIGEVERPWLERIVWILVIMINFGVSVVLIHRVWSEWKSSPVLVTLEDQPTPVWEIPFPAITMCSSNKYNRTVFPYDSILWVNISDLSEDHKKKLTDLLLICHQDGWYLNTTKDDYPLYTNEEFTDNINQLAPSCNTISCYYPQNNGSCEGMIQKLITTEGVCYSFNLLPNGSLFTSRTVQNVNDSSMPAHLWTLEKGYLKPAGAKELPLRASGVGRSHGVFFQMDTDQFDLDYSCRKVQGFKFAVTSPETVPRMDDHFYHLPLSGVTYLAVTPKVMDTSDKLWSYSPSERLCYFPSERKLTYFNTYTQTNCEFECLTNFTLLSCKCVEFYMPRIKGTSICGIGSATCVSDAENHLNTAIMEEKLHKNRSNHTCSCLPSCKSIHYTAEISQASMEHSELVKARIFNQTEGKNYSSSFLNVFIKVSEFIAKRREERYTYVSFLANCGGLLGLCCGISVISFAELLYFCTLRLWINMKKIDQHKVRKDSPNSVNRKELMINGLMKKYYQ